MSAAPRVGGGCLRCAHRSRGANEIVGDRVAHCASCGREWLRLPLFAISGASGVGKTSATEPLARRLPRCVRLDGDLLWRHEYNEDEVALARFYWTWLRIAVDLHQSGRPLVFSGNVWPERWETLPERAYVETILYLVLVCDPAVHEQRLRARGPGSLDEYYFPRVLAHNEWLRANGTTLSPQVTVLDTTDRSVADTTAAIADWVEERLS